MNSKSQICSFIAAHEDWEDILENQYRIKIKKKYPYAIFNYDIACDFSDPIVQEARGIIIHLETLEVACWPFRKFGNYNEAYADAIDWNTARVQEKVDGSIIKYWFDWEQEKWVFSTNSMIDANEAIANEDLQMYFGDIIQKTKEYQILENQTLDKSNTYILELVSPYTKVIVSYPKEELFHIGTRNRHTGEECNMELGIQKPKDYPLQSLSECIHACEALNANIGKGDKVKAEGFVVVDGMWNRVKIKSPEYLVFHRAASIKTFSKERIIEMILNQTVDLNIICQRCPDFIPTLKYYEYKIAELDYQADMFCKIVRRLYEEYQHDRKLVADHIKKHPLAYIGFYCLSNEKRGKDILRELSFHRYCKLIPIYKPESLIDILKR